MTPNHRPDRPEVGLRSFTAQDRDFFASLATDPRVVEFVDDGLDRYELRPRVA